MLQPVYKDSFQAVELEEQYLEGQYHLAYLHGKGRHFVPVLIPLDCVPAIEMLIAHRGRNGIGDDNQFVFASRGKHHI